MPARGPRGFTAGAVVTFFAAPHVVEALDQYVGEGLTR